MMLGNVGDHGQNWGVPVGRKEEKGKREEKRAGTSIHLLEVW